MAKRLYLRPGDIFKVPIEKDLFGFIQFVDIDPAGLYSDVIRMFKFRTTECEEPDLSQIVQSPVIYFTHTTIKVGVKFAGWEKCGNFPIEEGFVCPGFRRSDDVGLLDLKISNKWYVWKLGDREARFVGKLPPEYHGNYYGGVSPPDEIKEILETGKSSWVTPGF